MYCWNSKEIAGEVNGHILEKVAIQGSHSGIQDGEWDSHEEGLRCEKCERYEDSPDHFEDGGGCPSSSRIPLSASPHRRVVFDREKTSGVWRTYLRMDKRP